MFVLLLTIGLLLGGCGSSPDVNISNDSNGDEEEQIVPIVKDADNVAISAEVDFDITGATTIQRLSDKYGIPLEDIFKQFSLSDSLPTSTRLGELRESYGVELREIKSWVQIKTN